MKVPSVRFLAFVLRASSYQPRTSEKVFEIRGWAEPPSPVGGTAISRVTAAAEKLRLIPLTAGAPIMLPIRGRGGRGLLRTQTNISRDKNTEIKFVLSTQRAVGGNGPVRMLNKVCKVRLQKRTVKWYPFQHSSADLPKVSLVKTLYLLRLRPAAKSISFYGVHKRA